MENIPGNVEQDGLMYLPPGFRFHPTDEELITHYLCNKVVDSGFSCRPIGQVDLNKTEPWELPWKAKMGEKEWYFFCMRDKKYPTGLRTNRATEAGYWKATGKDREIYRGKSIVGMKKTLVFYIGRAPKGEKSNWVMHEYRLDGNYSAHNLPKTAKNEWVICRAFNKNSSGCKIAISGLVSLSSSWNEIDSPSLPSLVDSLPHNDMTNPVAEPPYVPCFSNQTYQVYTNDCFDNFPTADSCNTLPSIPCLTPFISGQGVPVSGNLEHPRCVLMPQQSVLNASYESQNWDMKQNVKTEIEKFSVSLETGQTSDINNDISSLMSNFESGRRLYDNQEAPSAIAAAPQDFECFRPY